MPHDVSVCYRIVPGRIAVERSDDGGAHWRLEWEIPVDEVRRLAQVTDTARGHFESTGLAILTDGTSYEVYVANGDDGMAVRSDDGQWERTRFAGLTDWTSYHDPVEIPPPPGRPSPGVIFTAANFALAGFIIARLALATARVGRLRDQNWVGEWVVVGLVSIMPIAAGILTARAAEYALLWGPEVSAALVAIVLTSGIAALSTSTFAGLPREEARAATRGAWVVPTAIAGTTLAVGAAWPHGVVLIAVAAGTGILATVLTVKMRQPSERQRAPTGLTQP